jgi:hypothetical protein
MKKYFLLLFASICLQNCFEYEETINFKRFNSGTLEINYTVPISPISGKSLIAFLPTEEEEIINKISKYRNLAPNQFHDFSAKKIEPKENDESLFKDKMKVSYKVDFDDVAHLEGIVVGTINIKTRGRSIFIKREFPRSSSTYYKDREMLIGEKKINQESRRLLKDAYFVFKMNTPINTEMTSNRGSVGLGNIYYSLPVSETLDPGDTINWDLSIRFF